MIFLEISKTQKLPQTHPKTKKSKNSKRHVRRLQMKKKFSKQTIVRIEKCQKIEHS